MREQCNDRLDNTSDPQITRQYGVDLPHNVCFEPPGWPGKGPTVSLGIRNANCSSGLSGG
jgi:hypothetical protein